jgi:hypothetical protein
MVSVLITIISTAAAVSLGWLAVLGVRKWLTVQYLNQDRMRRLSDDLRDLGATIHSALISLGNSEGVAKESQETIHKLLAGLIEVSRSQVEQLEKLEGAIGMLRDALFGDNPKALQEYDTKGADLEGKVMDLMKAEGMTRRAAEERFGGVDLDQLIGGSR